MHMVTITDVLWHTWSERSYFEKQTNITDVTSTGVWTIDYMYKNEMRE